MLVVVVIDLANRPRFFVGAAMDLPGWPYFRFIEMFVVELAVSLGKADDLAISRAVLMGADVVVGFSGLSLW